MLINGKIYKILGIINLNQINNLNNTKGVSNWISVTFDKLENMQKIDHSGSSFKTNNLNDLLSIQFTLLDTNNKKIEFIGNQKKISILNFKIGILNEQ